MQNGKWLRRLLFLLFHLLLENIPSPLLTTSASLEKWAELFGEGGREGAGRPLLVALGENSPDALSFSLSVSLSLSSLCMMEGKKAE